MEIRLCDITNNKSDIRDYFIVEDGKMLINGTHLYDVILDTDKATLHQQMEMFDSKDEMFKKAKAWDSLKEEMRSMFVWGSDLPKGTPSKYMNEAYGIVFKTMCELDGTNEFSNLLSDTEDTK